MKNEAMDLATAVRILVWGEGRLQPPDRTALAQRRLFEALSPLVKQVYAKYRLGGRLDGEVEAEFGTSEGDVLHDVFVALVAREGSPPGAPPQSNEAARAYLAATVRHYMVSEYRRLKRHRSSSILVEDFERHKKYCDDFARHDDDDVRRESAQVPEEMVVPFEKFLPDSPASESERYGLEMTVNEGNWEEVLERVIEFLMEVLSRLERNADDAECKAVAGLREALARAIRSAASEFRAQGAHVFVFRLLRLARCWSGVSTMEEEVLREAHMRGLETLDKGSKEYRRIRNNLDQQNKRTLTAVYEHLVREGVNETAAHRLIKALSIRLWKTVNA